MKRIHCDINHIEDGLEQLNDKDNHAKHMAVWDTDCVMRGIPFEEMEERNILIDDPEQICGIEYVVTNSYRFRFHQNQVEYGNRFSFCPYDSSDCTTPDELGENLAEVVEELESILGELVWDFSEVNAASVGYDGNLTDFEFEYDLMAW